ncbi:transglycosylase SLT domain-containing protein [Arenimonas daejeonensis]|uniref:transglycosylase SLT domain-containing protein n=1 Tax=Arenimonas daejeonensis TaxID=370777 RepID=UPI0013158B54|nr:transglycosylase SLT domain-containing protein [Arenimonas daejeonensis]
MISSTARNHGIHIKQGYDGRLSPVESTDAALSYLQKLDGMFDGEWRAMAMAYNAGEYRIVRAFRANGDQRVSGESHLPKGLSRTTYDYVAKLHALACLIAKPERHGLVLPREARFVPLARMTLPAGVHTWTRPPSAWAPTPHACARSTRPTARVASSPAHHVTYWPR